MALGRKLQTAQQGPQLDAFGARTKGRHATRICEGRTIQINRRAYISRDRAQRQRLGWYERVRENGFLGSTA